MTKDNLEKGKDCLSHIGLLLQNTVRLGELMNNRNLFLSVLEVEKSKIKSPTDSLFGENLLSS